MKIKKEQIEAAVENKNGKKPSGVKNVQRRAKQFEIK